MTDTDRLAALLEEIGLDFWEADPYAHSEGFTEMEFNWQRYAARLAAAGVTLAPQKRCAECGVPLVERLERICACATQPAPDALRVAAKAVVTAWEACCDPALTGDDVARTGIEHDAAIDALRAALGGER